MIERARHFIFITALALAVLPGCEKKDDAKAGGDEKAAKKVDPAKAGAAKPAASTAQPEAKPEAKPEDKKAAVKAEPKTETKVAAAEGEKAPEPETCGGAAKADKAAGGCGGCGGAGAEGCGGADEAGTKVAEKTDKPAGKAHFGGAFTMTDAPMDVADVIAKSGDLSGKNIKVKARVAKVCKKKGCWMTLQPETGGDQYVRVTMKDYGFFVPLDCDGKTATVEGTFKSVELPEAQRKHLAEDGGDDPAKVQGKARELSLVATAIDIE